MREDVRASRNPHRGGFNLRPLPCNSSLESVSPSPKKYPPPATGENPSPTLREEKKRRTRKRGLIALEKLKKKKKIEPIVNQTARRPACDPELPRKTLPLRKPLPSVAPRVTARLVCPFIEPSWLPPHRLLTLKVSPRSPCARRPHTRP